MSTQRSEKSLQSNPPADNYTLLRRVYVDLICLPPEPEEVTAFVSDDSPDAYEKVVDRLLSSAVFRFSLSADHYRPISGPPALAANEVSCRE